MKNYIQFINESLRDKMVGISEEEIKEKIGPHRYKIYSEYKDKDFLMSKSFNFIKGFIDHIARLEYMESVLVVDKIICTTEKEFNYAKYGGVRKSGNEIIEYRAPLRWDTDDKVEMTIGHLTDGENFLLSSKGNGMVSFFYDYINKPKKHNKSVYIPQTGEYSYNFEDFYKFSTINFSRWGGDIQHTAYSVNMGVVDPNGNNPYQKIIVIKNDKSERDKFKKYMEEVLFIPED